MYYRPQTPASTRQLKCARVPFIGGQSQGLRGINKLPLGRDGRDAQDRRKTSAFRQHVERHSGLTGHCSVRLQVALLFCEPLPVEPVHALGWRSTPLRASGGRLVLTTRATGLMSSIRRGGHMQPG